jgi:uncharacterized membrane protein YccC
VRRTWTLILTLMPGGTNWSVLWKTITRFDSGKIIPWIALRNTIGVAAPLAAGLLLHQLFAGLVMSTGALNVAFSDGKDPYEQRARRMFLTSLFCGFAVALGSMTGRDPVSATIVAALCAFAGGMMVALGSTAGDIGTVSIVVLVVFAAQPMAPGRAISAGLLAFAGGVLQTALSVVSWLHRRYEPERRALGQLYASLKKMVEEHVDSSEAPPATAQSSEAGKALLSLTRDYSLEGERYRSLLNQAERARLSILAIKRLRARMRRDLIAEIPERLDRVLEIAAQVCDDVGRLLLREVSSLHDAALMRQLQDLADSFSEASDSAEAPMIRDARFQVAALAGQLRAALSLASHSVGTGQRAFERQEARKPWTLRLTSSLAILRANLSLHSTAFRHALRLSACIAIGVAAGRGMGLIRPYWIPMTIAIVLKPDFSSTFSRGVLRLGGTYGGLLVATGLFHVIRPAEAAQVALLAAFTFLCRCFGPANYGILTAAVSGLVVLLIAVTGVAPQLVIGPRALNTTFGGLLALIAYVVWPTWESTQLPEGMAGMLDAYRRYFRELTRAYLRTSGNVGELEHCRLEARVARTNMEASLERYRAEPGAAQENLERIMSMLASSHRFAHAAMSLEAELAANPSRDVPEGFCQFFEDVDRILEHLVAALRGEHPDESRLPDLRQDHSQLLRHAGAMLGLLTTETDRIANSLNTLHEQIEGWGAA